MAPIAALCCLVVVQFCSLCNVIEPFSVRQFSQDWRNICFLVPCPFNQRCCLCACGNYGPPSQGHQFSLGKCYCSGPAQSTQPKTKTKICRRKYGNLVHHSYCQATLIIYFTCCANRVWARLSLQQLGLSGRFSSPGLAPLCKVLEVSQSFSLPWLSCCFFSCLCKNVSFYVK